MRAVWLLSGLLLACGSRSLAGTYYDDTGIGDAGSGGGGGIGVGGKGQNKGGSPTKGGGGSPSGGGGPSGGGNPSAGGVPSKGGGGSPAGGGFTFGGKFGGGGSPPQGGGFVGGGAPPSGGTNQGGGTIVTGGFGGTAGFGGVPNGGTGGVPPVTQSCRQFCAYYGKTCGEAPAECVESCPAFGSVSEQCQAAGTAFFDCSSKAVSGASCDDALVAIQTTCAFEALAFFACGGTMPGMPRPECVSKVDSSLDYCRIMESCPNAYYETMCNADPSGIGIVCACSINNQQRFELPIPQQLDLCTAGRLLNCSSLN